MANVSQSVTVCAELQTCLNLVSAIVINVKNKVPAAQVVQDALPALAAAFAGLGELSMEVTAANGAAVDATVALWGAGLKQSLLPGSL